MSRRKLQSINHGSRYVPMIRKYRKPTRKPTEFHDRLRLKTGTNEFARKLCTRVTLVCASPLASYQRLKGAQPTMVNYVSCNRCTSGKDSRWSTLKRMFPKMADTMGYHGITTLKSDHRHSFNSAGVGVRPWKNTQSLCKSAAAIGWSYAWELAAGAKGGWRDVHWSTCKNGKKQMASVFHGFPNKMMVFTMETMV